MNSPLRFESFLRPMVWGGRRLETTLGKRLPSKDLFGESWEISDHSVHRSIVAVGIWAGRSLRDLMQSERECLFGPASRDFDAFPWLIKFLDCNDLLSVQVHPDLNTVRRLGINDGSKTEAWFVVDASPESRIYAGLRPEVNEATLREALRTESVVECLHSFEPTPGDCVFLPAGTVHAVGGGVLMAEIQETSDATFRLFDWGRPRQLHVQEALASIDWNRGPVDPIRLERFDSRQSLVRCPYFHLDYRYINAPTRFGGDGRMQALVILDGAGRLITDDGDEKVGAGQAWLFPASMSPVECQLDTPLKTLLCTLP